MSELSNTLKYLIRDWLFHKFDNNKILSDELLTSDNINSLVNDFLSTKPYNIMKNESLILSMICPIMQIEIYRILL